MSNVLWPTPANLCDGTAELVEVTDLITYNCGYQLHLFPLTSLQPQHQTEHIQNSSDHTRP